LPPPLEGWDLLIRLNLLLRCGKHFKQVKITVAQGEIIS